MPKGQIQRQLAESIVRDLPARLLGPTVGHGAVRSYLGTDARTDSSYAGADSANSTTHACAHAMVRGRAVPEKAPECAAVDTGELRRLSSGKVSTACGRQSSDRF